MDILSSHDECFCGTPEVSEIVPCQPRGCSDFSSPGFSFRYTPAAPGQSQSDDEMRVGVGCRGNDNDSEEEESADTERKSDDSDADCELSDEGDEKGAGASCSGSTSVAEVPDDVGRFDGAAEEVPW